MSKRITKSQLSIRKGDMVIVTRDNGSTHSAQAESDPWKLGGHTWVLMLSDITGCFALARCKKMPVKALLKPVRLQEKQGVDLGLSPKEKKS